MDLELIIVPYNKKKKPNNNRLFSLFSNLVFILTFCCCFSILYCTFCFWFLTFTQLLYCLLLWENNFPQGINKGSILASVFCKHCHLDDSFFPRVRLHDVSSVAFSIWIKLSPTSVQQSKPTDVLKNSLKTWPPLFLGYNGTQP